MTIPVIDIHSHFFPKKWPDFESRFGTPDWPWMRHENEGRATVMVGSKPFRPVTSACWDPAVRLDQMDRDGVDAQIICATPVLFAYDRPAEQALEVARLFNDAALEICSAAPDRLYAMCQVPLQDTDAACAEASRSRENGHVGVQIGTHVGPRDLDDGALFTFLHHCADIDLPVFVHPWDMIGNGSPRLTRYMLPWLVGMAAETQLSILSLILSGAFERLPVDLKLCFAHGGGSFPYLLGRADNAWHNRDIVREDCPHPPSHYVDRFSVDGAVFSGPALRFLIETMGPDQVMLGTDYPFPLGEQKLGVLVRTAGLEADVREKVQGGNAAKFFGITRSHATAVIS